MINIYLVDKEVHSHNKLFHGVGKIATPSQKKWEMIYSAWKARVASRG